MVTGTTDDSAYALPGFITPALRPWLGGVVAFAGFLFASAGFFNFYFKLGLPRSLFNQYSEIMVIVVYGIPLVFMIKDRYQKVRMSVMITLLFTLWYIIPVYFPFNVNLFGVSKTTFPGFEMPGAWTQIVLFALALLFGRRVKCGWMNTCVALKETAGAPFRHKTKRGTHTFKLARLKFVGGFFYLTYFIVIFLPGSHFKKMYIYWFWTTVVTVYFGSLFLSPFWGNRIWCRWICPFLFGWANIIGFFRIRVNRSICTDCGKCENGCDFGLPIRELSKINPMIRTTECMGCGRCRSACPQRAISFYDVRDFIRERLSGKK